MPILPLPQFEADLEADRKTYEALKAPKTIVVRYGSLKMVGEFPYDGSAKPGCGSKLVVRTFRGTELGEMLTSTCPNSGCSKSVSRQEMLQYIENSGGRDFPFSTEGRVLRIATGEDLDRQAALEQSRHGLKVEARTALEGSNLPIKIVDVEPILGGERLTIFYSSEERIDFREVSRILGQRLRARVELRQVGARDEARITADYERCGQYCCCKNFLKVLKPVSMRSAKVQKATLDPLKISGRCGRLMCCLRYEDQTYEDLRKRLPRKKTRVGTPEGDGLVIDGQILTQLVLVQLEAEDRQVAIPVENLTEPKGPPPAPGAFPLPPAEARGPRRDRPPSPSPQPPGPPVARPGPRDQRPPQPRPAAPSQGTPPPPRPAPPPRDDIPELDDIAGDDLPGDVEPSAGAAPGPDGPRRRRRRRRRRGNRPPGEGPPGGPPPPGPSPQP